MIVLWLPKHCEGTVSVTVHCGEARLVTHQSDLAKGLPWAKLGDFDHFSVELHNNSDCAFKYNIKLVTHIAQVENCLVSLELLEFHVLAEILMYRLTHFGHLLAEELDVLSRLQQGCDLFDCPQVWREGQQLLRSFGFVFHL